MRIHTIFAIIALSVSGIEAATWCRCHRGNYDTVDRDTKSATEKCCNKSTIGGNKMTWSGTTYRCRSDSRSIQMFNWCCSEHSLQAQCRN